MFLILIMSIIPTLYFFVDFFDLNTILPCNQNSLRSQPYPTAFTQHLMDQDYNLILRLLQRSNLLLITTSYMTSPQYPLALDHNII